MWNFIITTFGTASVSYHLGTCGVPYAMKKETLQSFCPGYNFVMKFRHTNKKITFSEFSALSLQNFANFQNHFVIFLHGIWDSTSVQNHYTI